MDFGNPGGGWRKIVSKGRWKQVLRGGGGFVLVSNSGKTSKKKVAGEKEERTRERKGREGKRAQFEKDLLHSKEGRQNVAAVLTKESGEHIDVEKVNTWVRNHKHKKRGSGGRGSGGS